MKKCILFFVLLVFYSGLVVAQVMVSSVGNYYEITNQHTGIRIPQQLLFNFNNQSYIPAPINAVKHKDGTWSSSAANYLSYTASNGIGGTATFLSMNVTFLKQTTSEVEVEINYVIDRPASYYGSTLIDTAGIGAYKCIINIKDNEPAIDVEEASNYDLSYNFGINNGVNATKGRYRGHSSSSIADGYEPNGSIYRPLHMRPPMDATVDFSFNAPKTFPRMAIWNPWISNSGWYWQLFNDTASSNSNIIGIYEGKASRAIGAGNSGVAVQTGPSSFSNADIVFDSLGTAHCTWNEGYDLYYIAISTTGIITYPKIVVAQSSVYPNIIISKGKPVIYAYSMNSGVGGIGAITRSEFSGSTFTTSVCNIPITIDDKFVAATAVGSKEFLTIYGTYSSVKNLHLFSTEDNGVNYTHRSTLNYISYGRQANRPDFKTLPDGRCVFLYTDAGGWTRFVVIQSGQNTFGSSIAPSILNFGSVIDSKSANMFVAHHDGNVSLLLPSGMQLAGKKYTTNLGLSIDHGSFSSPNSRTLATDNSGNSIVMHDGSFYSVDTVTKTWTKNLVLSNLALSSPFLNFDTILDKFNVIGRKNGILSVYSYNYGDISAQLIQQFPELTANTVSFKIDFNRRAPDASVYKNIRYCWGIFVGKKGVDLKPETDVQPINVIMNKHGGLGDGRLDQYQQVNFTNSPAFQGALFLPQATVQRIITKVKTDNAYYSWLYNAEPTFRDILDAWRDPTGVKNKLAVKGVLDLYKNIKEHLTNKEGIYSFTYHYWHGGLEMQRSGIKASCLLADNQTSQPHIDSLKMALSLFGNILWDDDFVPFSNNHGLNMGTANMPVQYKGYRSFYALVLADDPVFASRAQAVAVETNASINNIVNQHGAQMGSPHYIGASMEPTLITALQLKYSNTTDLFISNPRLKKFAEFYMNLITPEEVRFGTNRKLVCFGDGSTEGSEMYGILANGFDGSDDTLSSRLSDAWIRGGKVHSGFFGSTVIMIDDEIPALPMNLKDNNFDGYYSISRTGYGTPYETATWLLNGNFYQDHRHDDASSYSIYALNAPLSISYGAIYYPQTPGGNMKNMVIPETLHPQWNQSNQALNTSSGWSRTALKKDQFVSFKYSTLMNSSVNKASLDWDRNIYSIHVNDSIPLIAFSDRFFGADTINNNIWSMHFMSMPTVVTPSGNVTPVFKQYDNYGTPKELPESTPEFNIPQGLSKFEFVGQNWIKHPAGGIDWDFYLKSNQNRNATLAYWGHTWHPSTEQSQYMSANGVSKFEEKQTILRVKGKGKFAGFLLPYHKGAKPTSLNVTDVFGNSMITYNGNDTILLGDEYYIFSNGTKHIVTLFDSSNVSAHGITIENGATEVEHINGKYYVRVGGIVSTRSISFTQGNYVPQTPSADLYYNSSSQKWEITNSGTDVKEYVFIPEVLKVEEFENYDLVFYPNPAKDEIVFLTGEKQITNMNIYDQSGKLIRSEKLLVNGDRLKINVSNLSTGYYFVEGISDSKRVFIKQFNKL